MKPIKANSQWVHESVCLWVHMPVYLFVRPSMNSIHSSSRLIWTMISLIKTYWPEVGYCEQFFICYWWVNMVFVGHDQVSLDFLQIWTATNDYIQNSWLMYRFAIIGWPWSCGSWLSELSINQVRRYFLSELKLSHSFYPWNYWLLYLFKADL